MHRFNPAGIPEHEEILPEWIMSVIETHVDRWVEVMPDGELRTILVGHVVESHAVLEVSDGVLDLGVAAMVGLQFQGVSLPVGDEGVIAVNSASQGLTRRTTSLTGVASGSFRLGHVGPAVHPASSPPRVWPL